LEKLRDPSKGMTMYDFIQALGVIASENYIKREELEKRFPGVYEEFEKSRTEGLEDAPMFDVAYNEWYDWVLYGEGTHDEMGNPLWDVIDARRREWLAKWGEEYYDMLLDVREFGYADKDSLLFKVWEDKQYLWEYWQIVDDSGNPDRAARLEYRKDPDNVDMEARLIFLGYVSTIQNPEAEEIVKQWCKDYNVSESAISAFAKWTISDADMEKYGIADSSILRKYWDALAGDDRLALRCTSKGLDAFLVDEYGYTPAFGTDRCEGF